jgi:secreted protein with Ig-like and vWFA domain
LPLYGSRIVFVIDFSGSMSGVKIEAAKAELRNAINLLPDATRFNMIAFNSDVTLWKKDLVSVSPQSKREATIWVNSGQAAAKTHSYDALAAALAQDCDAIYFLTDGAPTGGRITSPSQIVSSITELNRVRRATINTLGIAPGAEGGTFDDFLHYLAKENFGVYKRLD